MSVNKKTREAERKLREAVWARDQGKCRCSGRILSTRTDDWDYFGDVAHLKPRSTHPELKYSPENAFLLSRRLHMAAHNQGPNRLTILGDDARKTLTFVMTDKDGRELWRRVG